MLPQALEVVLEHVRVNERAGGAERVPQAHALATRFEIRFVPKQQPAVAFDDAPRRAHLPLPSGGLAPIRLIDAHAIDGLQAILRDNMKEVVDERGARTMHAQFRRIRLPHVDGHGFHGGGPRRPQRRQKAAQRLLIAPTGDPHHALAIEV